MRIPKFYFGDISRATTNYVLLTECVPFAPGCATAPTGDGGGGSGSGAPAAVAALPAGAILPKVGKYQDHRLRGAHEYYFALMRAMARIGAADKRGALGPHRDLFARGTTMTGSRAAPVARPAAPTADRRAQLQATFGGQLAKLRDFVCNVACGLVVCRCGGSTPKL